MELAMLAIRPLLPKLGDLLAGEFTKEKRVRKGVESLNKEMMLMQAALNKVAKVPPEELDEGIKIWAGMVRDLAYQMEDIIDAFMVRVDDGSTNPKNRVKKLLKKTGRLFKKGKDLHRISDAVEEVVGQAKQLAELRQRYELETQDTDTCTSVDPRTMALYTDVTELVGIEEPRDELIDMLLEGDDWAKSPLKTVSVVGFGGLGKTTLAKTVYDKLKVQFDCGAFVSVSRNPDMKKILKDILFELDKNTYRNIYNDARQEKHLIDELIEFLHDKRHLVVIDDIWDEHVWKLIKCAFSKSSLGSRLITTTRIISVSKACCSSSHDIYRMKPLPGDISRRLFYKRVFSPGEGCPHELVEVSEHILKKCGGIPLAIISISSLLASNHGMETKTQWGVVLNSIGHGLTEDHTVKEMKKILLFSYYDLPSYLKPCLLYLSIFPEDHKIRRDELIWKWISEGFICSEEKELSLYDLGNSYFNELVNRSMIQPIGIDSEGKVEACHVHDMVLDLICSLASEENFVTILDGTQRKRPNSPSMVRRLSIQNKKVDVGSISMVQVRSITAFTKDIVDQLQKISSFQVLRVFDLEGCRVLDIGMFLHLRYLRLNDTGIKELPMDIGKLQFLEFLDVGKTSIEKMPSSVVRLKRLMYLGTCFGANLPSGMRNLNSLEVLQFTGIDGHHFVEELGLLTKLRVLRGICGNLDEDRRMTLVESLSKLHKLEILDIYVFGRRIDLMQEGWVPSRYLRSLVIKFCSFDTLPAWINPSSFPLLSHLRISVNKVQSEDIQLLGTFRALRFLSLWVDKVDSSFSGEQHAVEMSVVTADTFPCVTECDFRGTAAVPSMFSHGAAPRLKKLAFSFPAKWISRGDIDLSMGQLPSLQDVRVELLCKEASHEEEEEAKAALRAAAAGHPNCPSILIDYPLSSMKFASRTTSVFQQVLSGSNQIMQSGSRK